MSIRRNFLAAILFILVLYKCYCEDGYLLMCENQTENVVCPKNFTINVITATYGYNASNEKARGKCDDWWNKYFRNLESTNCHHPDSTYIVADECNGLSQCTISASNKMFGDPCPGVTKYFELYYNCTQDKGQKGIPNITTTISGKEDDDNKLDEGGGGGNTEGYSSYGNSKSPDDRGLMTTGLSAVAVVAIAAGIPIAVAVIISIVVILTCILAIKRRRKFATTNDRNMSVNQHDGQGLTMTALSNIEDSEMVYNSAYQSVPHGGQSAVRTTGNGKIDDMRTNYENLSEVESTNESPNTKDEEAVYNEAYQSINGNEPKR